MTNLLVPTDFTPASVKLAEQAIKTLNKKVNIVFFHAFQQPYFYSDIIRTEAPYTTLMTDNLRQSCKLLKDAYPDTIGTITFSFMRGDTNAIFRNFLEANNVDVIVCPQNYTYIKTHADSLNPIPFFKRSRKPLLQNIHAKRSIIGSERLMEMANAS